MDQLDLAQQLTRKNMKMFSSTPSDQPSLRERFSWTSSPAREHTVEPMDSYSATTQEHSWGKKLQTDKQN